MDIRYAIYSAIIFLFYVASILTIWINNDPDIVKKIMFTIVVAIAIIIHLIFYFKGVKK